MRFVFLLLAFATATAVHAQTPDSTAAPLVAERTPRPLGVQILAGSLGGAVGGIGGAYLAGGGRGGLDALGAASAGIVVGTLFGATLGARGVGRQDRTGWTLGGAALGMLGGALVASAIAPDDGESLVPLVVFTISVGTGAALGNRGTD